jgi:hypothetical protein
MTTTVADEARENEAGLQNELTEDGVSLRQGKLEHDELATEIRSLKLQEEKRSLESASGRPGQLSERIKPVPTAASA